MNAVLKLPKVQNTALFNEKEFDEVRQFFSNLTGNKLGPDKKSLVESRLRKRLMETGLDVKEYIKHIKNDEQERSSFISSLTTHKTDWFRENVHFEFMKKIIADRKKSGAGDMLVWSAACSTGEEPYTLLMTMLENGESRGKILCTDISESCVKEGSRGIYAKDKVSQQVRADLVSKYFLKAKLPNGNDAYQFDPQFKRHFKWRNFNLMSSELPAKVHFDFIFVRNVLIYFEPNDCKKIIQRLTHYLKPGGFIVVGLSETVYNHEQVGLRRVENSVYQKV